MDKLYDSRPEIPTILPCMPNQHVTALRAPCSGGPSAVSGLKDDGAYASVRPSPGLCGAAVSFVPETRDERSASEKRCRRAG